MEGAPPLAGGVSGAPAVLAGSSDVVTSRHRIHPRSHLPAPQISCDPPHRNPHPVRHPPVRRGPFCPGRLKIMTSRLLYAPNAYAAADPASIVRAYPFALLITHSGADTLATSAPIFFETDDREDVLIGHFARRNPQADALSPGQRALAVFSGPHAYISAAWYRDRPTVPTWNYVSAHVRGRLDPIDDPSQQLAILRRTAQLLERDAPEPWTLEQAPPGRVDFLLPMIRSFRITIERIEGVTKLSQTHGPADRLRVMEHLLASNDDGSHQIARLMAQLGLAAEQKP
jgi:transcriptional regulator